MNTARFLPLVMAWPLFQNNLDNTMLGTALPTMAAALDTPVLHLNLAITCYLLGLALCLPLSGWAADRWGARRIFMCAVALFSVSASLSSLAGNLETLVALRLAQGAGAALMLPASRILLLRHVAAGDMVEAMVWFTIPGSLARMLGPLAGGALVTWFGWQGVFLFHLPVGAIGLLLLWRFLPADDARPAPGDAAAFDGRGFVLLAVGLTCMTALFEIGMKGLVPTWVLALLAVLGLAPLLAYRRHALAAPSPMIDLRVLRHRIFRTAMLGSIPLRISIGSVPFLLPLLLQAGFGLTPMASGLITVAGAIGSLGSRGLLLWLLKRVGFRKLLLGATACSALCCVAYGLLRADTPAAAMFALMLLGGVCTSLAMVALNSLGYTEVGREEAGHASTTGTVVQQLSIMTGVTLAAGLLSLASGWRGGGGAELTAADFPPVFTAIAVLICITIPSFLTLREEDGEALRRRPTAQGDTH
jgi:MFS family permease